VDVSAYKAFYTGLCGVSPRQQMAHNFVAVYLAYKF